MSSRKAVLELRFLRLPTIWKRHKSEIHDENGVRMEYFYAPEVDSDADPEPIEARQLLNQFLRMEHSEDAALKFLGQVGVWVAVPGAEPQSDRPKTLLSGEFGYRVFRGVARPVTLEELWAEQERWRVLRRHPEQLRKMLAPPPGADARVSERMIFTWTAEAVNTLPVHLEWKKTPRAVLQPITGREMLIATSWLDLVSGSPFQDCDHCGQPFSSDRKRKYCPPRAGEIYSACAHAAAQAEYKKREDRKKRQAARRSDKARLKAFRG